MAKSLHWALFSLLLAHHFAQAATVLQVSPKVSALAIAGAPPLGAVAGDTVCWQASVTDTPRCGTLGTIGPKGFVLKLDASEGGALPKKGAEIEILPLAKRTAEPPPPQKLEQPSAATPAVNPAPVEVVAGGSSASATSEAVVGSPHGNALGLKLPKFRVLFDFLFTYRSGLPQPITFDTYHNLLWLEYRPIPSLQFAAEVSPNPRFFEIGYQLNPRWRVRLGRLWIPFDDLGPHTLYGGRANLAKLSQPSAEAFLPDVWTDLGVGLHGKLFQNRLVSLEADLYVVNGFQEGGSDPVGEVGSYPDFGNTSLEDNNYDKAIGARLHLQIGKSLGLGVSGYRGRYSDQSNESASLWMFGTDAQWALSRTTDLRFGYIFMSVNLISGATDPTYRRGGFYAELGQRLGKFKVLLRGGQSQNDSRVTASTDQSIVGAAVLYRPGAVQLSLEGSHDLNRVTGKNYYTFVGARVVAAF